MSRFLRLVVGNISWTCGKSDLRSYFNKFGEVRHVRILMNYETGFNRSIAFVGVSVDAGNADKIIQDYHIIDGREVTVNLAKQIVNGINQNDSGSHNI